MTKPRIGTDCSTASGSCQGRCVRSILRMAGLRPTWQRMTLGSLLFTNGHRHASAEQLFKEAEMVQPLSLATVYNTLNQFAEAGLVRKISLDSASALYDTDTSNHCHLYYAETGDLVDIDPIDISTDALPDLPDGVVATIDVLVTVRPKAGLHAARIPFVPREGRENDL